MTEKTNLLHDAAEMTNNILDLQLGEMMGILPDPIIILDDDMQILHWNGFAEKLFGYSASEVIGQSLDILLPERSIQRHHQQIVEFLQRADPTIRMGQNRIVYGKSSSGDLIPLDIFVTRIKIQDQSYFVCVLRNHSEQINFKIALSESEQRYRAIIDSQYTMVMRTDRAGLIVFANRAYCQKFGKKLVDLIGVSFTPQVHPEDIQLTWQAMHNLESLPNRVEFEQRVMTSMGWRWIAWETTLIRDPGSTFYEIQWVGVDVTEHKQIETELSNKIALLAGIFDSIPDQFYFKDVNGIYLGCNPEYARFVGKPVDQIIQKTDFDLFNKQAAELIQANDRKMIESGRQHHNEEWIKYPDGHQILLDTLKTPLRDVDGNPIGLLGISRDITSRSMIEEVAIVERNLAMILAQKSTLVDALPLCLDLAIEVSGMDSGGIYILDRQKQELVLMTHKGLSADFVAQASNIKSDTERYQLVMKGEPVYQQFVNIPTSKGKQALAEGLRVTGIVPVRFDEHVIACINIASHKLHELHEYRRSAIENLSIHIGSMIARFQAQEELAESQNELQSMFDSLQDYVFVLDDQGGIIQINQRVLDKLGYSRDDLIGQSVLKVHPPELHDRAWQIVGDMLNGIIDTCPLDLICKDGSYIPVETKVAPGRWGNRDVLIGISRDVTDRKAAEAKLSESVREVESFFDVSLDLLCIADLQGNFIRVNKSWTKTLGYSEDEILNKNLLDFVHPDDQEATIAELVRLGAGQMVLNFINRYSCKDGSWRYIEWRSIAQGPRIFAAARDVSERKRAEDLRLEQTRLLEYRHKFEETLNSISTRFINLPSMEIGPEISKVLKQIGEFENVDRSYIFEFDRTGTAMNNTYEWCAPGIDPQIENLQDLPMNMLPWWMGKLTRLEEVYIPIVADMPDEARVEREILEMQSIQSVLVVPLVIRNRAVGFLGFDSVVRQRFWSPDSILLIKMVSDTISNALMRIQMQSELAQSESRNTALLSAVPDMIFRIRLDGIFIDYKASSTDLLAVSPDHIKGNSIKNVLPISVTEEAMVCIEQALETKEIQTLEYTLKIGDSSHVFEARFKDSGKDEVTAIVRDVSDRARLEQMKSDFINRATHELRTPIATMLLMVNLIDGQSSDDERREYWDVLKSELARERILVEDLLSAGRLESNQAQLHFRDIDCIDVLKQAIRQMELPARDKGILVNQDMTSMVDQPQRMIHADETAMTQVFINLLSNAIKFTPVGGRISILARREKSGIEISISDTGMGIPSEDLPLLFNRFFRGTNAIQDEIQGTGIGLFIVRSILDKHGGSIKVHSELNKGSEFTIWMPIIQA